MGGSHGIGSGSAAPPSGSIVTGLGTAPVGSTSTVTPSTGTDAVPVPSITSAGMLGAAPRSSSWKPL